MGNAIVTHAAALFFPLQVRECAFVDDACVHCAFLYTWTVVAVMGGAYMQCVVQVRGCVCGTFTCCIFPCAMGSGKHLDEYVPRPLFKILSGGVQYWCAVLVCSFGVQATIHVLSSITLP